MVIRVLLALSLLLQVLLILLFARVDGGARASGTRPSGEQVG